MSLDTAEKRTKAVAAVKAYREAVKRQEKAAIEVKDKVTMMANAFGNASINGAQLMADILADLGQRYVDNPPQED